MPPENNDCDIVVIHRIPVSYFNDYYVVLAYFSVDWKGKRKIIYRDELRSACGQVWYWTYRNFGPTDFKGYFDINEAGATRRKVDEAGAEVALLRHPSPDCVLVPRLGILRDVYSFSWYLAPSFDTGVRLRLAKELHLNLDIIVPVGDGHVQR